MFKILNLKTDFALGKFLNCDFLLRSYLHPTTYTKTYKTNKDESLAKQFFNTNLSVYD